MFERFTEPARRVVFFARREASAFGSRQIETHHMLLGLLEEAPEAIEPVALAPVKAELLARFPPGEQVPVSVDLLLSDQAKRALACAAEEAERLSHWHIGVEHLALGLAREPGTAAAEILSRHGLALETMRTALAKRPLAAVDVETALHRLPPARRRAAARIIASLAEDIVTIRVEIERENYTVSFPAQEGI